MRKQVALGILLTGLVFATDKQTFTGVITDNMCNKGDHKQMHMGDTDAQCVVGCVKAMGGKYILFDGTNAYVLSDQKTPEKFAASKVTITGTLDPKTKTIQVEKIAPAK